MVILRVPDARNNRTWVRYIECGYEMTSGIYNWRVIPLLVTRGDIYYADLRPVVGSEQGGVRPVLIIQNEAGNRHSSTVICAAITSRQNKAKIPTHVELAASRCEIAKDSVILLEQVRTIDKQRLREKVCHLDDEIMSNVNRALKVSLAL